MYCIYLKLLICKQLYTDLGQLFVHSSYITCRGPRKGLAWGTRKGLTWGTNKGLAWGTRKGLVWGTRKGLGI